MHGAAALTVISTGLLLTARALLGRRVLVVTVRGPSMEPTYRDGDRVLIRRDILPAPGRVVVAEPPWAGTGRGAHPVPVPSGTVMALSERDWLIKRVAAVPGDLVPRYLPSLAQVPEERVPPGQVVLLGDNAEVSLDSRQMGYVPLGRVLGTVVRVLESR
ncbi:MULTISPECIES: S26 family signal peptidase [Streptomyces]|uniref:S26 family signal peptidase n=1 Tax=Streptomyces siderophoricus TaxID=2802281 RepID=A0ABS1N069_9ACTN|nr:S26 family signal peptidase [Streptomyces sp. 9-7]MBL1093452.1 S26 family signal peptidase [Streptomyces sp. 9-7]